jgi:hypothetical protein
MSHKKYRQEKNCLNCGTVVEQKFCPNCGQENVEIRDSFFHMVGHFLADYFHYDSKFFTNLKLLITKPGFLTKEYLEGKRVRHIHPLRLFFFITIVMVLVANLYYKKFESEMKESNTIYKNDKGEVISKEEFDDELTEEDRTALQKDLGAGMDTVSKYLKYILFFLLPVYALVFKLLYRKKLYVDHLVYTLHLQSFLFLFMILLFIITMYAFPTLRLYNEEILFVVTAIYVTMSLRFLYQQSWTKTILKSVFASFAILFLTAFVNGILILAPYFMN